MLSDGVSQPVFVKGFIMRVLLEDGKRIIIELSEQEMVFMDNEANENGLSIETMLYQLIGLSFIMGFKSLTNT